MASSTSAEDKKLKEKIRSIHTYSKSRKGEPEETSPAAKRAKKAGFHSYAKTWPEAPPAGCQEASLPPAGIRDDRHCKRPLRRSTQLRSLPSGGGLDEEKAFLLQLLECMPKPVKHSTWVRCAKLFNQKFNTRWTVEKCRNTYRRALSDGRSTTPVVNESDKYNSAGTSQELEMATEELVQEEIPPMDLCPPTPASPPPPPPPVSPRLSGLDAAEPAHPRCHDDPPPSISIEESYMLMQAVLTLSSAQIASVALRTPSLRAAIQQQLSQEQGEALERPAYENR